MTRKETSKKDSSSNASKSSESLSPKVRRPAEKPPDMEAMRKRWRETMELRKSIAYGKKYKE